MGVSEHDELMSGSIVPGSGWDVAERTSEECNDGLVKFKKTQFHPRAVVWRISEGAPMGEWVDRSAPPPRIHKGNLPDVANESWITSSRDLRDGMEVREVDEMDVELLEQWFAVHARKTATLK